MPKYQKKKHSKLSVPLPKIKADKDFEIVTSQQRKASNPRVIRGNKPKSNLKIKVFLGAVSLAIILLIITLFAFPVGIIETFNNFSASIGSGEYPIKLSGTKIINAVDNDNYFYALTDLNLYTVSNSGKIINSVNHGYSNPVIKVSKTRVLIYDQGQNVFSVFTANKQILSKTLKKDILCSDISDSGVFAIATLSDSYASTVTVYSKKASPIFTWNCAKGTINAVSVSPNGKRIAVSTIAAVNGELSSKIYIFSVKKTDPQNTIEYENKSVYSLSSNSKGVFCVTNNGYDFFKWSNSKKIEEKTDFKVEFFRTSSYGAISVFNRENDRGDNKIRIIKNNGKKKNEFSFKGIISDIRQNGSHIFIISEGSCYIYNLKGKLVSSAKLQNDFHFIIPSSSRTANLISDNIIENNDIK
ncbi:MAG: DUF5711 family protein [Clostridia bacterium]|nr:DUF5711 family protein [Clostridia bacterium]